MTDKDVVLKAAKLMRNDNWINVERRKRMVIMIIKYVILFLSQVKKLLVGCLLYILSWVSAAAQKLGKSLVCIVKYLLECQRCPKIEFEFETRLLELRRDFAFHNSLQEARIADKTAEAEYYRSLIDHYCGKNIADAQMRAFDEMKPLGVPASRSRGLAELEMQQRKKHWDEQLKRAENSIGPEGLSQS